MNHIQVGKIDCYTTDGVDNLNYEAKTIYKNLYFPCFLVGTSKREEWQELYDLGFGNVAEMTWFCHSPIFGLTCGHCNPCQDALHEGMTFRVSKIGMLLGTPIMVISFVKKILHRIFTKCDS